MERLEPTEKFRQSLYLLPIFGTIPAIWRLTRTEASSANKQVSRTSITLAVAWAIVYFSCWQGSNLTEGVASIRLLYTDALITTGYFGLCFWLMLRVWQGRSINILNLNSKYTEEMSSRTESTGFSTQIFDKSDRSVIVINSTKNNTI